MKNAIIILLFTVLTIIVVYPLSWHLCDRLIEPGDSLLNTWVISYGIQKLTTDPLNLFHANIFYPYPHTLAYTEHMIGNAVLGMPVYFLTNNPILVYNFVLLATFIIGGWGMYLLIRYLTGSTAAGIIGGIIFVFNPYRFYEITHIHVMSSQWLPFTLLFLHKYFNDHKTRHLFFFSGFFALQAATSGHIGLYQCFITGVFLFFIIISRDNTWGSHWLKFVLAMVIIFILLLPLYIPYIHLAETMKFIRSRTELPLFSVNCENFIKLVYPGLIAIVLSILGVFYGKDKRKEKHSRYLIWPLNALITISLTALIYMLLYGGFDLGCTLFGIKIKAESLENPLFILIVLLVLKYILQRSYFKPNVFYTVIAIASLLLCFGPEIKTSGVFKGPYIILYDYFPGFKGLRVPARWTVIFMFSLSVLAGCGWAKIERVKWIKYRVSPLIIILLILGFNRGSLALEFIIGKQPSVYEWIKNTAGDPVIIELPMPDKTRNFYREAIYMYWSLVHNKKMINGYSGYSPPVYWYESFIMSSFPSEESVNLLRYLGVRYIIIHDGFKINDVQTFQKDLNLRYQDGTDFIYELIPVNELVYNKKQKESIIFLDIAGISADASHNSESVKYALDGNLETHWSTRKPQESGMWFQLDLGRIATISGIMILMDRVINDFPRGIRIQVSSDGNEWKDAPSDFSYARLVSELIEDNSDPKIDVDFKPVSARFLRLSNIKENEEFYWTIPEIRVKTE